MIEDRFRFRVWDKEENKYKNGMEVFDYMRGISNPDRYILEQCSGLKDKIGKLIYEGDILKPNSNTITKEVVYEDGSYWAKDTIYFHDKCHIFQRWIDECGYEIVGNIHTENINDM